MRLVFVGGCALSCTAPHAAPTRLTRLHDPCEGRAVPSLLALSNTELLLGCSGGGGVWWSTDAGSTFAAVPGGERASVVGFSATGPRAAMVHHTEASPARALSWEPGAPAPRLGIGLPPRPAPAARSAFSPPPEALGDVRAWVVRGDRAVAVGSRPQRPYDGLALVTTDRGGRWQGLAGDPPVLEAATAASHTFWIAGDGYLARGTW